MLKCTGCGCLQRTVPRVATSCDGLRAFSVAHDVFAAVEVAALAAKRGVRPLAHRRFR